MSTSKYTAWLDKGDFSRKLNGETDVTADFGNYQITLCKTKYACEYSNRYQQGGFAVINKMGSSLAQISSDCYHERAEILYLNHQENVVLYRRTTQSIKFDKTSSEHIILGPRRAYYGSSQTTWFNQWCKLVLYERDIERHSVEEIVIVESGVERILHTTTRAFPSSEAIYMVFIFDIIKQALDIKSANIMYADPDIKAFGSWYGDSFFYPQWCQELIGSGDFIWDDFLTMVFNPVSAN